MFLGSATVGSNAVCIGTPCHSCVHSGGSSDKLGADEGGHPTPAGGVLWGVKSGGLAIRLNSYLTAEKEIVWRVNRS